MKAMKKVELIIESVYTNRLIELFNKHDIHGYTIIKDIEGCGSHGLVIADEVSGASGNVYIFTLCEEEKYNHIDADIRKFLSKYGGKCILSDAMILIGY